MHWKAYIVVAFGLILGSSVMFFYWNVIRNTQGLAAASPAAAPAPTRQIDQPMVTFVDPSRGPKDAKITIIEFGDYLCPFCLDGAQEIDKLLAERPKDVRFVWKNDPSPLHPDADIAARAAMCADKQGKFWEYHAALMNGQETYTEAGLAVTADNLGLNAQTFGACLSNGDTKPLVDRTVEEGRELGIQALPTYFINGKRFEGALSHDQLVEAISAP